MTPITTQYRGYHFRSRLEARWAVFFDTLRLSWEYEPEGFQCEDGTRYLPDFRIQYPGQSEDERDWHWFEVKHDLLAVTRDEWHKMARFSLEHTLIMLDGAPGMRLYCSVGDCLGGPAVGGWEAAPRRIWQRPYTLHTDALHHERPGYALWHPKRRLWADHHHDFFKYQDEAAGELEHAMIAARSARFESYREGDDENGNGGQSSQPSKGNDNPRRVRDAIREARLAGLPLQGGREAPAHAARPEGRDNGRGDDPAAVAR